MSSDLISQKCEACTIDAPRVTEPDDVYSLTMAPQPAKTRANVPIIPAPIFFSRVFFMAHPMSSIRLDTAEALSVAIGCHDRLGLVTTSLCNRYINVTDSLAARFSTALFMAFTRTLTKRGRLSVCGDRTKYGQPAVVMTAIRRNLRGLPSRFEHQSRTASVSVL